VFFVDCVVKDMPMATIREARESDAEQIAAIYAPYVRDTAISFEVTPPTATEMGDRIRSLTAMYPWLVCPDADAVLGYAYASRHRERAAYLWSVDVSVYVRADAHRRGIGRALYSALLQIVAAQGFCNAYGGITLPNASSVGLHESMGFKPVGVYRAVGYKLGAWHDVGWWELALTDRPANPLTPQPIDAVRGTPAWQAAIAAGEARMNRSR
jgi:phosphinothricin acetyltransferase